MHDACVVPQLVEMPTVVSFSSFLQRIVNRPLTIQLLMIRDRRGGRTAAAVDIPVPRDDFQGFLLDQGTTSSSHSLDAANEVGVGGFSWEKSAASAAIPSPIVPASVSSWTRAHEDLVVVVRAELEDDEEPLIEEEEDPSGWSLECLWVVEKEGEEEAPSSRSLACPQVIIDSVSGIFQVFLG